MHHGEFLIRTLVVRSLGDLKSIDDVVGGIQAVEIVAGVSWLSSNGCCWLRSISGAHVKVAGGIYDCWSGFCSNLGGELLAFEGSSGGEEALVDSADISLHIRVLGGLSKHNKHGVF